MLYLWGFVSQTSTEDPVELFLQVLVSFPVGAGIQVSSGVSAENRKSRKWPRFVLFCFPSRLGCVLSSLSTPALWH